ncbi:hypothetical protein PACTADRAFT_45383 [Pachysolen tannophilus NRRL Y-2460]|uniref:ABC transporter domain-containing protein n=1 Tax=Pachysolen tannophilus NRRL Y-2460 TaxID=669874 RepID=A0A1E4TQ54_PACTA|nr:hypothetical protein PACTADRAFT_45383 [Pachysolen tannophilus NRRL Y-2460]
MISRNCSRLALIAPSFNHNVNGIIIKNNRVINSGFKLFSTFRKDLYCGVNQSIKPSSIFFIKNSFTKKAFGVYSKRFNSSFSNEDSNQNENENGNESKKSKSAGNKKSSNSFQDIWKLLKLVQPESKLISIGLISLIITSGISMIVPFVIGKVIDTVKDPIENSTDEVKINILNFSFTQFEFYSILGSIFLIGAFANFGRVYFLKKVSEKLVYKLRTTIIKKLLYQDLKFWDFHKSGDLISRLVNDSTVITKSITQNLNDGLRGIISGIVGVTMMLCISVSLTGYMLILLPPVILIGLVFGRKVKNLSRAIQQQLGYLTKVSEEQFSFVRTIQSFCRENYEVNKFNKELTKLYDLGVREARLSGTFHSATALMGNSILVVLLVIGTGFVRGGELTIGELSSFMMYTVYTGSSVFTMSSFYSELMKGVGASTRVFELLDMEPSIKLSESERKNVVAIDGDIEFKNVSFHYPSRSNHQIFDNFSLKIKKGDHICLVGQSGCGKSTLIQLLLRHYDIQKGEILINNNNLKNLNLQTFRNKIGIVQQEPMLFSGTIRENLLYSNPTATEEEIIRACKLSNCYDFIMSFPDNFDTVIGSKGTQLSGGQKQRIALARVLLLDPEILILDEATSALDNNSELSINDTLKLLKDKTTISVAHRLSTIKMSDKIAVFGKREGSRANEILEVGDFEALYNDKNSELFKLLKRSKEGDNAEVELESKDEEQVEKDEEILAEEPRK